MSTFRITAVNPEPSTWQSAYGQMMTYRITGSLDGGPEETAQINTKADTPKVPYVGEVIDCFVAKTDPQHGKTLKRTQTPPGVQLATPVATPRWEENNERQDSIIRQSSFERAILIQAKKADILIAEKKYSEAHEAVKFKTITDLSDYIAEYAKGKLINPPRVNDSDLDSMFPEETSDWDNRQE